MSNYRVHQVLAVPGLSRRELRFLVALATYLDDGTRTARVGMRTLTETAGLTPRMAKQARGELAAAGRLAYRPGRYRGDLTAWTVLCIPEKGAPIGDPLPGGKVATIGGPLTGRKVATIGDPLPGKGAPIGDPLPGEKRGSPTVTKGGHQHLADQQEREHCLNPIDKPSTRAPARTRAREDGQGPETGEDEEDEDENSPATLADYAIAEVRRHTGITITTTRARRGLAEKMNRAGIRNPRAWLAKCIANDPAWWLDTPMPPRFRNGRFEDQP